MQTHKETHTQSTQTDWVQHKHTPRNIHTKIHMLRVTFTHTHKVHTHKDTHTYIEANTNILLEGGFTMDS